MTPAEKVEAYFNMSAKEPADRQLFDEIVHDDVVLTDSPAGVKISGKEAIWQTMDVPVEHKQGPGTMSFHTEFIEYIGDEHQGYASWKFRPAGAFALLWGFSEPVDIAEADAVEASIAIKFVFKEGKIISMDEFWNPIPVIRQFGIDIPEPGIPGQ